MVRTRLLLLVGFSLLVALAALAQNDGPGVGQGWLPEFNHSSRQILALANATPAAKFAWRPGPGVRSVSEVYMHIVQANDFLLRSAGMKIEGEEAKLPRDAEKSVTQKDDVIRWLNTSFETVRKAYPPADPQRTVKFFGADAKVEGVYLRLLVHNHEHMGQSIAYARTNGIVPPWSK